MIPEIIKHLHICGTSVPGDNTVYYNTVLDITLIIVGPQLVILDYFCFMSSHFTLIITRIG